MTFIQLVGVIKQCVKVLFDPMNNGLGRTTIPFMYYMLALVCLIMFILYLLRLLKTVISRLAPDTGNFSNATATPTPTPKPTPTLTPYLHHAHRARLPMPP